MGSRDGEYALRMAGADYEAIAAQGGGIVASMRAVRVGRDARSSTTLARAARAHGVARRDHGRERRAATASTSDRDASSSRPSPTRPAIRICRASCRRTSRSTRSRPRRTAIATAFAREVARAWLPSIAAAGLARFVDAYVDRSAFSVDQARPVLERARELGLGVRVHAGQFADVGAAELAAELGAASADHLEQRRRRAASRRSRPPACAPCSCRSPRSR